MNKNELNEANIHNLTCLWKIMKTQPGILPFCNNLNISVSWPNRCWFDWATEIPEIPVIDNIIFQLKKSCIVPMWDEPSGCARIFEKKLIDNGFELLFEQTAMYLNLQHHDVSCHPGADELTISSEQDIENWTNVASSSFEYTIDVSVIRSIADDPDIQLLLSYVDGQPAASAMLYRTGSILGIHQLGVTAEYRGKGIARKLMQYIIAKSYELTVKYITLQASDAGKLLYKNLGFKQQFMIRNYQRPVEEHRNI